MTSNHPTADRMLRRRCLKPNWRQKAPLVAVMLCLATASTSQADDDKPSVPRDGREIQRGARLATAKATADVDAILAQVWQSRHLPPAPACSNELYLRRVTLDLAGRPPTLKELAAFRASPDRGRVVDQLLASPEFSSFWASAIASQWCGHQRVLAADREVLRNWLEQALSASTPYDRLVSQVIVAEGESASDGPVNFLLRHREQPATKLTRLFLGVRLDCAQCHDHPFDRWTQDDHNEMQRFFAGMRVREISQGNLQLTSTPSQGNGPRFLTGASAKSRSWRNDFALYTTRSKPFARTFANRLWYHFIGRGIVHPIDDLSRSNPPVSSDLLERLSDAARTLDFDIRGMCRVICHTKAYACSSESRPDASLRVEALAHFALRTIKPLTLEQHLRSLESVRGNRLGASDRRRLIEAAVNGAADEDFSRDWEHRESAQTIMTRLTFGSPWRPSQETPAPSRASLFRRTLSRDATEKELAASASLSLDELAFVLIHGDEFCTNY